MNFLRTLRERTMAKPKPTEQPTAAREVLAAKASLKTNKLRNYFRPKAAVNQNAAATSGEFRLWSVSFSITNNLTEEPAQKQKNVFDRIKVALRPRRSNQTRPDSSLSGQPGATPTLSNTTITGQEVKQANPSCSPESTPVPAPSVSSGSDVFSSPAASDFSAESDAETLLTAHSKS